MDIALIVLAFICVVIGIIGAVVPGLPGPPVAWLGLLILFLSTPLVSTLALILYGVIAAIITVIDYVVPSTFTKRFGGSRLGVWGCNIGLLISIIGLPFGPQGLLGLIFWPFAGAFVGEMIGCKDFRKALKAACGAFFGFLTGTFIKLAYGIVLLIHMIVLIA